MPELPESEVVVRGIRDKVRNNRIVSYIFADDDPYPKATQAQLRGKVILDVFRRGKYIIFQLDEGFIVSHLRMTGQWIFSTPEEYYSADVKYFRWGMNLKSSRDEFAGHLWFRDIRRFGTIEYLDNLEDCKALNKLGVDGLEIFSKQAQTYLSSKARFIDKPIKNLLLDQSFIAGTGNIYCSESLWAAKVNPFSAASTIVDRIPELCSNLYDLFEKSIKVGGCSISDFEGGSFQNYLKVYGREGKPCPRCGSTIKKAIQAGRSTFYCESCQSEE